MSTWELASTVAALVAVVGGVLMHHPGAVLYDAVATRLRYQPSVRPGVAQSKPAARVGNVQSVPSARLHNLAQ